MANAVGRLFTYDAEGAVEERIMFRRSDVQHAVMEKKQLLGIIHGELETFRGREPVNFSSSL